MLLDEWLQQNARALADIGIGTGRLDCLVLLEDCLSRDRAQLLAHPETVLQAEQLKILDEHIARRLQHEPLAYIRGKTEFYGREFVVDHRVLEPRPESELMIDVLKKVIQDRRPASWQPNHDDHYDTTSASPMMADIGSGSGCLGITAALELHLQDRIHFYDIDSETLIVAKTNARTHDIRGQFYTGNLLADDFGPYDIVLANLPYVPDNFHINEAAMREPSTAIFGGPDGLELYRQLFGQLHDKKRQPSYIFTEALPPQHEGLTRIARTNGFEMLLSDDFIQVFIPVSRK